jgi:uncharacterized membrane protein YgdD (TMEM256/DUF423 family)
MTKTTAQAAAVLSALMTLAVVAGMNGIATKQYASAERVAQVAADATQVAAVQRVVVVARRIALTNQSRLRLCGATSLLASLALFAGLFFVCDLIV